MTMTAHDETTLRRMRLALKALEVQRFNPQDHIVLGVTPEAALLALMAVEAHLDILTADRERLTMEHAMLLDDVQTLTAEQASAREHLTLEALATYLGWGQLSPAEVFAFVCERERLLRKVQTALETQKSDAPTAELALLDRVVSLLTRVQELEAENALFRKELETPLGSMLTRARKRVEELEAEQARLRVQRDDALTGLTDARAFWKAAKAGKEAAEASLRAVEQERDWERTTRINCESNNAILRERIDAAGCEACEKAGLVSSIPMACYAHSVMVIEAADASRRVLEEQVASLEQERDAYAGKLHRLQAIEPHRRIATLTEALRTLVDELKGMNIDGVGMWPYWLEKSTRVKVTDALAGVEKEKS